MHQLHLAERAARRHQGLAHILQQRTRARRVDRGGELAGRRPGRRGQRTARNQRLCGDLAHQIADRHIVARVRAHLADSGAVQRGHLYTSSLEINFWEVPGSVPVFCAKAEPEIHQTEVVRCRYRPHLNSRIL